jgi:hypothetical protein
MFFSFQIQFSTISAKVVKIRQNPSNSIKNHEIFAIRKQNKTNFVYFCIVIVKNQENGRAEKHT